MTTRIKIEKVVNGFIIEDMELYGKTTIHTDFVDVLEKIADLLGETKPKDALCQICEDTHGACTKQ